jgi:cell division protein FtsQ
MGASYHREGERPMEKGKIVSLEDRIPKLKEQRKRKTNKRLVLLLSIFFILILVVIYFQSPLSRVHTITVEGNAAVSDVAIIKESGVTEQTNIWNLNKKTMKANIQKLPEIKSASISLRLPNSLLIHIKEYKKIAYVSENTHYYPVLEDGSILKGSSGTKLMNAPILTGFEQGKYLEAMVGQLEKLPAEILNSISEIQYAPEKTDGYHITLYMNDGNEVSATILTFSEKITNYPSIVSQLNPKQKGIIDLEVGSYFEPFNNSGTGKKN